jgi:hypothetical protein
MDFLEAELRKNDREQFADRLIRFREIDAWLPNWEEGVPFGPHLETELAFQDARFAYVNGFWIAAILSALAALERHIAWRLANAGEKNADHLPLQAIIDRGRVLGFVTPSHANELERLRKFRNDYAHFRENSRYWSKLFTLRDELNDGDHECGGVDVNMVLRDDAKAAIILASAYFGAKPIAP